MKSRTNIEIVPAILRKTFEGVQEDWEKVQHVASHIQIDVTDGIFAGDGSFRDIQRLKQLENSQKIELHMMVQHPEEYRETIIDLLPARCVFHVEAFAGSENVSTFYEDLRKKMQGTELGLALNPESPITYIEEHLAHIDYVLFMGYSPGFAGQDIQPQVFVKIAQFNDKHPGIPIAVDGHVGFDTVEEYARAGARILCANSAIFSGPSPIENMEQLRLKAQSVLL